MEFKHYSVLLEETIEGLQIKPDGIYVDGTLGGGGHAYHVCKQLDGGRFIGIDQDAAAIAAAGKRLAAICAAPSVLGVLGLAKGHKVTCFPGWEGKMDGAEVTGAAVETDRLISTGRGMGCSIDLGLELVKLLVNEETSADLKQKIQYDK